MVSQTLQIVPSQQPDRTYLLDRRFLKGAAHKIVSVQVPVTRQAVQAMQGQVLVKAWQSYEPLQRGSAHARYVLKPHVIGNQRENLLTVLIRKAQARTDDFSHANSHIHMAVEANAIASFRNRPERARFSYIMQKNAPGQRGRSGGTPAGKSLQHQQS